ncbi:MAG: hypothetical protein KA313_07250 [Pseudarcicella sp.]|nr:hypothetical protein [Pseudarcicella sp.]
MKTKQPTNRKRQWLAFFTVGLLLFSVFYACKTIDEEPSIQTIYSQG